MLRAFYCLNVILLLATGACKRDKLTSAQLDPSIPDAPAGPTGSAGAPVAPEANALTAMLTKNFWVFEHYVRPIGENQSMPIRKNKGMWFQFHADGTYVAGQWQKTFDQGSWFMHADGNPALGRPTQRLFLDSALDDSRDVEYEVQGIAKEGMYMSWVKVVANSVDQDAAMMKVLKMYSLPTPASIGVDSLGNPL